MADELLPYYEKELAFIRQQGAEFAKEHPKIAGRLGIAQDTIEDPHVSRLIESVAYLNARIQHKLDDDFPELSDAMLGVLFPHYQRPLPSMSICQFVPDKDQLEASFKIAKGTLLDTEQFQGEHCRFSTIYPVELQPVTVEAASIAGRPFNTPGAANLRGANSVLHIQLKTFTKDISFADLGMDTLRFYLKGQSQHVNPLYEMLLNNCLGIAVADNENDVRPRMLPKEAIQPVGFAIEDGLLPYPAASFTGYRLLTEFFAFPEKFMFIDLCSLLETQTAATTNEINIYCYLSTSDIELEHNIDKSTFALGCTPIINLFNQKADPIKVDHSRLEYQILPDSRRPIGLEVYSIDKVTGVNSTGQKRDFNPLYGLKHHQQGAANNSYWISQRRQSKFSPTNRDDGTDVHIQLVDLNFNPNLPDDCTLVIETQCTNRDLPGKLPFNTEQPKLQCVNAAPPCSKIKCITQPTLTIRPPLRDGARWRLLSHLNLNHLSITGGAEGTEALKEVLRLYNFKDTIATRALIESIQSVNARAVSAPLNIDGHATLCRGVEIDLIIDDSQFTGSSSYLFASVLEHFFGAYCSINSFTRVLVRRKNKEGFLKKCPPRSGQKILL